MLYADREDVVFEGGFVNINDFGNPFFREGAAVQIFNPAVFTYTVRGDDITIQAQARCFDNPPLLP